MHIRYTLDMRKTPKWEGGGVVTFTSIEFLAPCVFVSISHNMCINKHINLYKIFVKKVMIDNYMCVLKAVEYSMCISYYNKTNIPPMVFLS